MAGKAVDKVILRPVRLIRNHHNIAPRRQNHLVPLRLLTILHRPPVIPCRLSIIPRSLHALVQDGTPTCLSLCFGPELLDGRKHHPAGVHAQQLAQIRPALRLHRRLAQQLGAACKRPKQLVVEVVAVGDHHHRGVAHGGMQDHAPGIERHGQALAGPLRVPDHADALVARLAFRLGSSAVDRREDRAGRAHLLPRAGWRAPSRPGRH